MKKLDIVLQNWRYSVVEKFINPGCELLDIGGFDGSFLLRVKDKLKKGWCIDPLIENRKEKYLEFIKAKITDSLPFADNYFDIITMLAVFEHMGKYQGSVVSESFRVLKQNGIVILTVPNSAVDHILKILMQLRMIDGMSIEEHSHFKSSDTVQIFEQGGFKLKCRSRFQLGLNNLFIFQKMANDELLLN